MDTPTPHPRILPREQWLAERLALLEREKELTRAYDELARQRRELPWVRVDKRYVFDTVQGPRTLNESFDGKHQLLVQHFMFAPDWDEGCKSCSFMADHHDGMAPHLAQRDMALLVVSRAPLEQIERFRRRMGWQFRWASSHGTDFNQDYGVSFTPEQTALGAVPYNYKLQPFALQEAPGISVFARDDAGTVFHTYSCYGRGVEVMMGSYALLDLMPRGRDEEGLAYGMEWVRHHDRYAGAAPAIDSGCCAASA